MNKVACEGVKLEIRDSVTKKILGTTYVMENLEFIGTFKFSSKIQYVYLTDGKLKSPLIKVLNKEKK
jgi:hypothetical protein